MFDVFFDSVEAPNGELVENFMIVRPKTITEEGVVGICILPEIDGKIGLMRGYRHQLDDDVWQAPTGFVDVGETAGQSALRELKEETGLTCRPEDLRSLGVFYPDAGLIEGRVAMFAARNCYSVGPPITPQEIGTSALHKFDRSELAEMIQKSGSIGGSTLIACFRYLASG